MKLFFGVSLTLSLILTGVTFMGLVNSVIFGGIVPAELYGATAISWTCLVIAVAGIFNKARLDHDESVRQSEAIGRRAIEITNEHSSVLIRKRITGSTKDEFGVEKREKWRSDLQYFINEVLLPALQANWSEEHISYAFEETDIVNSIDAHIANLSTQKVDTHSIPDGMDPYEFEGLCAKVLRDHGWDASPTSGSGDQGADVIAKKSGKTLVLQCKLYSQPVGNKAVQEVIAAKSYYGADHAAVVTNASYTVSAKDLAHVSGVSLLSFGALVDEGI